eukprot:820462-Prymnesium_polylepis.1
MCKRFQTGRSALVPIRPLRFEGSRLYCRTPRRPAWHAPAEDGAGHGDHCKTVGDGGARREKYGHSDQKQRLGFRKAVLCSGRVWSYPKMATGGYSALNTALGGRRVIPVIGLAF